MAEKRTLLSIEQIKEVDAADLAYMIGRSNIPAARVQQILFAAVGMHANFCIQAFWETEEEQKLFNTMAAVVGNSSIVKR